MATDLDSGVIFVDASWHQHLRFMFVLVSSLFFVVWFRAAD